MVEKKVVAAVGLLGMVAGVLQIFQPQRYWTFWERLLFGQRAGLYAFGLLAFFLGLFLLYLGIRRLVLFGTLIWIVGALSTLTGLAMLVVPAFFLDMLSALFYARAQGTMMVLSYISGIIRFFVGVLLLIAGISPRPRRETTVEPVEPEAET